MTTYTAIANGDIDAESPINVTLMTLIRDNPIAITEGSSGAPKIQAAALDTDSVTNAKIAAGAVHQAELSTGTEEHSHTSSTPAIFTLSSVGDYGFFPRIKTSDAASGCAWKSVTNLSSTASTSYTMTVTTTTALGGLGYSAYIRVRYVNSSPPYDLGDGDVARFVYAEIKPSGEIVRVWNADDPPWRGLIMRGRRQYDAQGRTFVEHITTPGSWGECSGDISRMDAYVAALKSAKPQLVELTNEAKISPMVYRPKPWDELEDPGNSLIILDPPSDIIHRIAEMMRVDDDLSPAALLHQGYLKIDNTEINRRGPPGVPVHGVRWK